VFGHHIQAALAGFAAVIRNYMSNTQVPWVFRMTGTYQHSPAFASFQWLRRKLRCTHQLAEVAAVHVHLPVDLLLLSPPVARW